MKAKLKVAIVGLGSIGKVLATNLVKGKREVIIAGREIEQANALSAKLGPLATPSDITSAITNADIIVFAVWFNVLKELLSQFQNELKGKIIVDPSNPIAPDENGGFKKIIGADESAGIILKSLTPEDAYFVKAFGTLGAASLEAAAFQQPNRSTLFFASDKHEIDADIIQLINDSGFDALRVGNIDQSIRIEVFGDLHEFGAIGKPVDLITAQGKI